jgi:hypothetical protein
MRGSIHGAILWEPPVDVMPMICCFRSLEAEKDQDRDSDDLIGT